jgi:hypothetical protein
LSQSAAKYKFRVYPSRRPEERVLLNNIDGKMGSFVAAIDKFWGGVTTIAATDELNESAKRLLRADSSFITPVQLWSPSVNGAKYQRGILFQYGASGEASAVEIGAPHDKLPASFPVLGDDKQYVPCAVLLDFDETTTQGTLLVWKNNRRSPYSLFARSFASLLRRAYGLTLHLEPLLDPDLLTRALESGGLRELRLTQRAPFKDSSDKFERGETAERDVSMILSLKHSRNRPFRFGSARDFVIAKTRGNSERAGEAFQEMSSELGISGFTYEEAAAVVELVAGSDKKEKVFSLEDLEPGRALNETIDHTLGDLPERLIETKEVAQSTVDSLFQCLSSVL